MNPLYQRFADTAARTPDALAIQAGGQALTHRQFLALADAQAARWQAQGLEPGQSIGWLGHNSPAMLAGLLACAKLGAVFVPLNWRLAAAELAAIADHAGLAALEHTPELADLAAQVRAGARLAGADAPLPPGDVLLVYTSGTTGEPKGALHTQHGMLANIDMATAVQGFTAAERVLAVLPLFHVGGLCIQVLPALAAGGAVHLQARFDPGAWLADLAAWRPTTSLLVPAVMQAILAHPGWPAADVASLRFLNSGSSIVPVALIDPFHARGVPMAQVYGSTETGPFSIALAPGEALAHLGSVGRPAPGVQLRLAAADGTPVAPGAVGEIQLRAPNLMRGYHRLPAGAGFVDGWYATGDLARADADGRVTVVGRSKDMIISGGENIYPAEIENLASTWPGVAEAAVVGLPDARWGEVPVLVLVPQPGAVVDVDGLQALFQARLARFKHPRRVVQADQVPRTALGKVQKAALAAQLMAGRAAESPGQPTA
ncbi:class I adenylate-forming enzyme family protein [Pseudaquabacterium pictum]|uniref:Acid--CoA ligase n=1 Tax=Pseudaquabacterium pictum TaxID=2315236 RepID=A0A480AR60_9BURK|nr:AMP-binding protein [Rubrivivax pictus]GCL63426.1 acid--CoA ligase [Rubrivivax pictus]